MILIADSGSTTTSWALLSGRNADIHPSRGFNPYYMDASVIEGILDKELIPAIGLPAVEKVFYYGSGCSTDRNCEVVRKAIAGKFPDAEIEVEHDLLGAARALLGRHEGIACILGTGSNSCYYDGKRITHNVPSLGYLFGDEGSGAHIGIRFLQAVMRGNLPVEISKAFDETYHYKLEDILGKVYGNDNPGGFLGSFTHFMAKFEHIDAIREIILSSFNEFFTENVARYPGYKMIPVSFTGSVAFHFRHLLSESAFEQGISIGTIEKEPMEGLIRYHQEL
jgi:glucosamine kinase